MAPAAHVEVNGVADLRLRQQVHVLGVGEGVLRLDEAEFAVFFCQAPENKGFAEQILQGVAADHAVVLEDEDLLEAHSVASGGAVEGGMVGEVEVGFAIVKGENSGANRLIRAGVEDASAHVVAADVVVCEGVEAVCCEGGAAAEKRTVAHRNLRAAHEIQRVKLRIEEYQRVGLLNHDVVVHRLWLFSVKNACQKPNRPRGHGCHNEDVQDG